MKSSTDKSFLLTKGSSFRARCSKNGSHWLFDTTSTNVDSQAPSGALDPIVAAAYPAQRELNDDLIHARFGHAGMSTIKRTLPNVTRGGEITGNYSFCDACVNGKAKHASHPPFSKSQEHPLGELIIEYDDPNQTLVIHKEEHNCKYQRRCNTCLLCGLDRHQGFKTCV